MENIGEQLDWKILEVFFSLGDSVVKYSYFLSRRNWRWFWAFFFPLSAMTTLEAYHQCLQYAAQGL